MIESTVDKEILKSADILLYGKVQVVNPDTDAVRSPTLEGPTGSQINCLDSHAARLRTV